MPALAADGLSLNGVAAQTVFYDDNVRLERDPAGSVIGSTTSIDVAGAATTPRLGVNLDLGADLHRFSGDGDTEDLDSLDWDAAAGIVGRFSRGELGAGASFQRKAVRESELEDTGLTAGGGDRVTKSVNGSASYILSPRDELNALAQYNDVTFDDSQADVLRNPFKEADLLAEWARELTPRDTGSLSATATFFSADNRAKTESQSFAIGAALERRETPRLTLNVGTGVGIVLQQAGVPPGPRRTDRSTTLQLSLGATYTLERIDITASFEQGIEGSARGTLEQERAAALRLSYRLTSETTFALASSYVTRGSDIEFSPFGNVDRTYIAVQPSLSWRFLPDWRLVAAYRFRSQDEPVDAESHSVLATVRYAFQLLP